MKKLNSKGFGAVEVLLIVVLVGIIGGLGWYVWKQRQNKSSDTPVTITNSKVDNKINSYDECKKAKGSTIDKSYPETCITSYYKLFVNPNITKIDEITILDDKETVVLFKIGDEQKLPKSTPNSFVTYISGVLSANKEQGGCFSRYRVSKISQLNIVGSTGSVGVSGKTTDSCGGGAKAYWYLNDGNWKLFATQMTSDCKTLKKMKIYKEFIPECFEGPIVTEKLLPNPNGSILEALN